MSILLKDLLEHNKEVYKRWHEKNAPRPNGFACPKCGAEMGDVQKNPTTSIGLIGPPFSPQGTKVICLTCGHTDVRFSI